MDIYRLISAFVMGVLLCQAALLLFLRVPTVSAWHAFRKAKSYTALACVVLCVAYCSSALMGWTSGVPMLLVWFVVAGLQALLFTFTCVIFVAPQTRMRRLVLWNLLPLAVLTMLTAIAHTYSLKGIGYLLVVSGACYFFQLSLYTRYFIVVYRANVHHLEEVYADDLSSRLAWVKRLFFSALALGLLAVVVILLTDQTLDAVFGVVVAVYYTYVTISFVNYMPRAAFVVKAAGLPEEPQTTDEQEADADSLAHVRDAVDRWVASKRFLKPDVSVDEIAQQMGVSRQLLNDYFSTVLHQPFRSWRIHLRIEEAKRILTDNPSIPTGELCARCGYNDRSNFHKHFQKVTGKSLAEWREEDAADSV